MVAHWSKSYLIYYHLKDGIYFRSTPKLHMSFHLIPGYGLLLEECSVIDLDLAVHIARYSFPFIILIRVIGWIRLWSCVYKCTGGHIRHDLVAFLNKRTFHPLSTNCVRTPYQLFLFSVGYRSWNSSWSLDHTTRLAKDIFKILEYNNTSRRMARINEKSLFLSEIVGRYTSHSYRWFIALMTDVPKRSVSSQSVNCFE